MTSEAIEKLLRPRSVALVGASEREHAAGNRILRNLMTGLFPGALYPVNPRYERVKGLRCYGSLAELPERVDAAFLAIPAEEALKVLEQVGALGIKAALINATGFADAGADGLARQERLVEIARQYEMAVCGPNNSGYINLWDRSFLSTYYAMPRPEPGPVALITQSGSVGIALSQDDRRLGLGYIITAGNEAVCGVPDYLRFVIGDDRIKVVMMFLEAIRDPPAFAAAAREAAKRGKPVIVIKVGRSESGRAAVSAHSGALAGEDAVCDAFLRRHGVVRAVDLDEMVETAAVFAASAPPASLHVVPVTLSGGEAGLIADLASELGVSMPPLATATVERLQPLLSPFFVPRNPLDAMGLGWDGARFAEVVSILFEDPAIGTVAIASDMSNSGLGDAVLMKDAAERCTVLLVPPEKRLVFFTNTAPGGINPQIEATLKRAGIPTLCGMRAALGALHHWTHHRPPSTPAVPKAFDPDRIALLATASEADRFHILAAAGVPMAPTLGVASEDQAVAAAESLGFPVVLKATAPDLPHKTELGLLKLRLGSATAVRDAYRSLAPKLRRHSHSATAAMVVQPMIEDGIELIIGLRNDLIFGPVILTGLGGTLVEIFQEVSVRLAPVDCDEARGMLAETSAATLLAGGRGRGPFDVNAAVEAIVALSSLCDMSRDLFACLEINPLIVRQRGEGVVGVDLLVESHRPR